MAFILPLVAIGSVSGFAAGYYYNTNTTQQDRKQEIFSIITVNQLNELKQKSPHKEINQQLISFNIKSLKAVPIESDTVTLNDEQKMIESLRQKILNRRHRIGDVELDLPVIS
jgi:2-keto-3-deoxy-galactonokinase